MVKSLVAACGFSTETEVLMRDIFVLDMNNNQIIEKLFKHDPTQGTVTFTSVFKLALSKESSVQEHQDKADRLSVKKRT